MKDKKLIERRYLDEARRASALFPTGEPVPRDPLDFLLCRETGDLGIEITELCRENERGEGARLGYVAPKAKRLYMQKPDAVPVNVSPVLSHEAADMTPGDLASILANFVYAHRRQPGEYVWDGLNFPRGYSYIGIYAPSAGVDDETGVWRYFRAFEVELVAREMLEACIAEKNAKLAEYRKFAPEVWLLIVNDRFLGPGEVYARADHLAEWTFNFDFDKVLVFAREPGGSGEVIELRREPQQQHQGFGASP